MNWKIMKCLVLLVFCACVMADKCASGSTYSGGNWYCAPVKAIQYQNVGSAGTYQEVTGMNPNGKCSSVGKLFSGPLAPLDQELSLHFRGPLHLVKFAAYKLNTLEKREVFESTSHGRNYRHYHKRHAEPNPEPDIALRSVNVMLEDEHGMVYATIDGFIQSWENTWFGPTDIGTPTVATAPAGASDLVATTVPAALQTASISSTKPLHVDNLPGDYSRIGYYDAESQNLEGLTFLGNHGGVGSGVFDYTFGASLSYLSADGTTGTVSPEVLEDTTIASNVEFIIMTDKACNNDCGFVRPNSVAYHGFEGANKVLLMEFQMPLDGNTGFNGDMPAIWMLNAQIPRTIQYGDPTCSCWDSGCGEFDIAEVLSPGAMQCKSTFHAKKGTGDSDYILRPTTEPMKLAVIFDSTSSIIHIQVLDKDADFGASLTSGQIGEFMSLSGDDERSVVKCSA